MGRKWTEKAAKNNGATLQKNDNGVRHASTELIKEEDAITSCSQEKDVDANRRNAIST